MTVEMSLLIAATLMFGWFNLYTNAKTSSSALKQITFICIWIAIVACSSLLIMAYVSILGA